MWFIMFGDCVVTKCGRGAGKPPKTGPTMPILVPASPAKSAFAV